MRLGTLALITLQAVHGQNPGPQRQYMRLAEEAENFARMATKVIGQESLEQVAAQAPPRYRMRGALPEIPYKTRQIVSEYAFAMFQDDRNLHEVRHVLTVDGRKVKEKGKLRETLSMGMQGDADRIKKRLVREFESYGLRESATDFGQALLMFKTRDLENFQFRPVRMEFVGADQCRVFAYEQKADSATAMTVFEGRRVMRHLLKGEVFLRQQDGVPIRITVDASRTEGKNLLRHFAVVDYQMSAHGVMLPAAVNYAESLNTQVVVENRFKYSDFKLFDASSELKFTVEEPKKPATPKK
jgi:hypothetical protein